MYATLLWEKQCHPVCLNCYPYPFAFFLSLSSKYMHERSKLLDTAVTLSNWHLPSFWCMQFDVQLILVIISPPRLFFPCSENAYRKTVNYIKRPWGALCSPRPISTTRTKTDACWSQKDSKGVVATSGVLIMFKIILYFSIILCYNWKKCE